MRHKEKYHGRLERVQGYLHAILDDMEDDHTDMRPTSPDAENFGILVESLRYAIYALDEPMTLTEPRQKAKK